MIIGEIEMESNKKHCPKCGTDRNIDDIECSKCGIIYAKYEKIQKKIAEEKRIKTAKIEQEKIAKQQGKEKRRRETEDEKKMLEEMQEIAFTNRSLKKAPPRLDCNACKTEKSMEPTKIPKFNLILRFIGYIILIPSMIGLFIACVILGTSVASADAAGLAFGFGFAAFIAVTSIVSGLIGWILIMDRKVFKCSVCGFVLDRD